MGDLQMINCNTERVTHIFVAWKSLCLNASHIKCISCLQVLECWPLQGTICDVGIRPACPINSQCQRTVQVFNDILRLTLYHQGSRKQNKLVGSKSTQLGFVNSNIDSLMILVY